MLDTIILQIPIYPFDKIDHDRFSPSTRDIFNNLAGFAKFINNPNKLDKDSGIYKPRLTMLKRAKKVYLKVEFSAPKLLFGNNLDEAEESDFNAIVCRLKDLISDMGVQLLDYQIKDAEVIGLHPSKNIKISKPYTSSFIIRELSKINLSKRLDLTKVSFQNDGESLQLYSNSYSIVIYDKISDLSKPPKRATDKDATTKQLGLFEEIKKNNDDLEILRIEIRLSKMPKLKEVLKNIEYYDKPILKNLFSKTICQKILKLYWNNILDKNRFVFGINNNPQKMLQNIFIKKPHIQTKTAFALVGLNLLCKTDDGIRGVRATISRYKPKSRWDTTDKSLKRLDDITSTEPSYEFINEIEKALNEFRPYKILNKVDDGLAM